MNRITNIITMHAKDKNSWFFIPWAVVGSSFAINLLIAWLVGGKTAIYTGGLASIYLYMLAGGVTTVRGTFPFAVGFSARRRDYFLGTVAMAVAVSAAWAILIVLLSLVEGHLIPNWGVDVHFFHLPYLSDGPVIMQVWTYFVVMVCMYFLGFAPASLYQRFGRTGISLLFGAAFLLFSIFGFFSTYWNWWGAIFGWLAQQTAGGLATWTVPVIAVCVLASFALLRKAAV